MPGSREVRRPSWNGSRTTGDSSGRCHPFAASLRLGRSGRGPVAPIVEERFVKPTFLIIGAPKCGTSSLAGYLESHPDVDTPYGKEPNVFGLEPERALDRYSELFAGRSPTRHRGEATTHYADDPVHPGIAARIHEVLPDARLLYLVGDPIRRVESYYVEQVAKGAAGTLLRIDEAVQTDWDRYVAASRYGHQLRCYLEHFPREQVRILFKEEMGRDPAAVVGKALEHLGGIDTDPSPTRPSVWRNRSADRLRMGRAGRVASAVLGRLRLRTLVPKTLKQRLRPLVSKPVARQQVSPQLRQRLIDDLRDDTAWFREQVREDERPLVDAWTATW